MTNRTQELWIRGAAYYLQEQKKGRTVTLSDAPEVLRRKGMLDAAYDDVCPVLSASVHYRAGVTLYCNLEG